MEKYYGSLTKFLGDTPGIPLRNVYKEKLDAIRESYRATPSPIRSLFISSAKISLLPKPRSLKRISKKILVHKENNKYNNAVNLTTGEKIHGELMLTRKHFLLRSMRVNLREDEKQQTEAKLENQGLEKLVSTLRKSRIESDVFKFKPFKSIVIPQRSAVLRNLKLNQKFWLEKHGW